MRPIPLKILNQSCTHKKVTKDSWGAETKTTYDITNIYIEPSNEIVKTKDNTEIKANTLFIYDNVNSICKLSGVITTPVFVEDDIIIFNSKEYRIIKIDTIYQVDTTDLHHFEIYLR